MTDEEKKAMETMKDLKEIKWYEHAFDKGTEILSEEEKQDIDVILNLLKKQDNRIKELEAYNYECNNIIRDYIEELEFKDKLIDAMLEVIEECRANDCLYSDEIDLSQIAGTEQIKQYFENLAKESGEIDEG